jgi:hypothetical protein
MENSNPQLKIEDLRVTRDIINLAVKRGAFDASECVTVGSVYERINTFLNFVAAQEAEAAKTEKSTSVDTNNEGE